MHAWESCQSRAGSQGDWPAPGRQPAAPYGRKPTGRGAAARRLSPHPQAASPVRNAPRPQNWPGRRRDAGQAHAAQDYNPADRPRCRAAVRAGIGGGFAARSYQVRRAWYGAAAPASRLLRTAHPRGGLRPVLTPEPLRPPPGSMRGQASWPARKARNAHNPAGHCE